MAEKTLNTRIKLKYDTASNWAKTDTAGKGANFVPKAGEVCFVQVNDSVASSTSEVTFKVGDGTHKFSELPYGSGKASDVYSWAKASGITVEDSGTGALISAIKWENDKLVITRTNQFGDTASGAVLVGDGVEVYGGLSIESGSLYVDDGAMIDGGIKNSSANAQTLTIPDGTSGGTNVLALTSDIPTALKNPNAIGGTDTQYKGDVVMYTTSWDYDGSQAEKREFTAYSDIELGTTAKTLAELTNGNSTRTFTVSAKIPTGESSISDSSTSANYPQTKAVASYVKGKFDGLATVATSGSYNDLTNKPAINNGTLTIKAEGTTKGTFTANQSGNTEIDIKAADLGLSSAMKFIGTTTTAISDGQTVGEITLSDGTKVTPTIGNVVLYNHKEFIVTNNSKWEELGDESSHALKTITITGTGALSGGGSLEANRTITHNTVTRTDNGTHEALTPGDEFKLVRTFNTDDYGHVTSVDTDYLTLPGLDDYNFASNDATLAWGGTTEIGTAGNVTYKVTMPANPNTHYTTGMYVGASNVKSNAAVTSPYVKLYDDSSKRAEFQIKGAGGTSVSSDASGNITITSSSYDLPAATASTIGGVKLGSNTTQKVAANSVTATASRTYAVQTNSSGQAVVNVPWINTWRPICVNGQQLLGTDAQGSSQIYFSSGDTVVVTSGIAPATIRFNVADKVLTTDDTLILDGGSSTVNI